MLIVFTKANRDLLIYGIWVFIEHSASFDDVAEEYPSCL